MARPFRTLRSVRAEKEYQKDTTVDTAIKAALDPNGDGTNITLIAQAGTAVNMLIDIVTGQTIGGITRATGEYLVKEVVPFGVIKNMSNPTASTTAAAYSHINTFYEACLGIQRTYPDFKMGTIGDINLNDTTEYPLTSSSADADTIAVLNDVIQFFISAEIGLEN